MDELLLRRAQKGDTAAFEQLVTPLEDMVWRTCYHYMGNVEDAKDAAQETMLKAWRAIGSYRADAALSTWLYRVAASCCTDLLRKRKARPAASLDELHEAGFDPPQSPAQQPETAVLESERRRDVRRALNDLPDDQRIALVMSAVEGHSYDEIAQVQGIAVGTVKSRINRARTRLAEILSGSVEQSASGRVQQSRRRDNR